MTSEVPPVQAECYRRLLGRTFKVTECQADPEFTAKVARIQEELLPKLPMNIPIEPQLLETVENVEPAEIPAQDPSDQDDTPDLLPPDAPAQQSEQEQEIQTASGSIESDGPCFSCPKKEKDSEKYEKNDALIQKDIGVEVPPMIQNEDPKINSKPNKTDKSPLLDSRADTESMPSDIDEDAVDSGGSPGYSSQETLLEDDPSTRMDIEEDVHSPHQEEDETNSLPASNTRLSVSNRIDLEEYSRSEWKATTYTAQHMRLGYSSIMEVTSCPAMRQIRGDNYCGLRATCFQILSQNLNVLRNWDNDTDGIVNIPQQLVQNHRCSWLTQWSFAGRLKVTPKKTLDTMTQCLQAFCDKLHKAKSIESYGERTQHFLQYFNSGKPDEVLLFEALKVLMLHSAVMLHEDIAKEKEVPVFAYLLFARDTSQNPEQLMKEHLNTVGDSGGLEQVEMFLLGYALNLTIRVTRPSMVEQEDFITFYPNDHIEDWDMCNLIAEDDRHYNILVQ